MSKVLLLLLLLWMGTFDNKWHTFKNSRQPAVAYVLCGVDSEGESFQSGKNYRQCYVIQLR